MVAQTSRAEDFSKVGILFRASSEGGGGLVVWWKEVMNHFDTKPFGGSDVSSLAGRCRPNSKAFYSVLCGSLKRLERGID